MKVLIIGSGGREHALAWKIKQSPLVKKIYCAPGNGGLQDISECVALEADDIDGLVDFAIRQRIDLTVVGPEAPLVAGIVDAFEKVDLKIFGPSKLAAQLEGSKIFAKEFMHKCNIPTAPFTTFDNKTDAVEFLGEAEFPLVIKADGLAAGKGVFICENREKALKALDQIMEEKVFKSAGDKIVIEECLQGEEASILAVSDGEHFIMLDSSQDHKRIFDDDLGPNTGGMGAYSPAPVITAELFRVIENRVIDPTIRGMKREGIPFKGVLYAGLMITKEGPMTLEYNVRFGDPEIQAILLRMKSDIVPVMLASCEGRLDEYEIIWDKKASVCVVMSSGGYPGKYEKGHEITGIDAIDEKEAVVFHAGTQKKDGKILTDGGRVLGVAALGDSIEDAIRHAYSAVDQIKFEHCFFRRDIGAKALARIKVARR